MEGDAIRARAEADPAFARWLRDLATKWARGELTYEEWQDRRHNPDAYMPLPTRGRRRLPRLSECEDHWSVAPASCIRCGEVARCERSHIIDRSAGGLDGVQNVVPLCYRCHRVMPPFWPGDEDEALAWLACPDDLTWRLRRVELIREQHPVEWERVERGDCSSEAVDALVRLPLDFSGLPRVTRRAEVDAS